MDAVMRRKKLQPRFSDRFEFIHSILRFRVDTQQNNVEKKCGFENTRVCVDKGLHLRRQIQSPKKKKKFIFTKFVRCSSVGHQNHLGSMYVF